MNKNLQEASDKLYEVIALDNVLRKEILKELVHDESVCFLLSISTHFTRKNLSVTRQGKTTNLNYQIGKVLEDSGSYWQHLGMKEQVVLKELLSNSNTFDSTIFYAHAVKVYSKKEILKYLSVIEEVESIPYLIMDSYKFYYKTKAKYIKYNTFPSGKTPMVYANQTIIINSELMPIAYGGIELGDYLVSLSKDFGNPEDIEGAFRYADSITAIQYNLNQYKGSKYALVFHKNGPIVLKKALLKETYSIIDFTFSEDFDITGVWFNVNGRPQQVKVEIPQTIINKGVDKYTITVECNKLLNGKINNVKFIKFNKKEE